jgi:structural maintenance of chromosome 4
VTSSAREVHSDGSNDYYLDDRHSSYTHLTDRLREGGLDLDHDGFLILQGEVELISLMKPKGATPSQTRLLESIEDANSLTQPISKVEEELAAVNAHRDESIVRRDHCQTERDAIEGGRNEAVCFLGVERELRAERCPRGCGGDAGKVENCDRSSEKARDRHGRPAG